MVTLVFGNSVVPIFYTCAESSGESMNTESTADSVPRGDIRNGRRYTGGLSRFGRNAGLKNCRQVGPTSRSEERFFLCLSPIDDTAAA